MMLVQDGSAMQHSGLELAFDVTDKSYNKSHDKSRIAPDTAQMERISEHNVSLFRKCKLYKIFFCF
jgi:hypothetical protein